MSVQTQLKRITVPEIRAHKGAKPVVCLTCYHAHTARLLDNHVDLMLVGDSLGMVMHGLETTLGRHPGHDDHPRQGGDARLQAARWWRWTCRSAPMRKARPSRSAMPPASSRKPAPPR